MKLKQAKRADPAPVRCLVSRAAGDCRTCGAYVDGNLHMPNWAFGWYCAQCCPACAGKPVRASEIRPVATRLEARQRPAAPEGSTASPDARRAGVECAGPRCVPIKPPIRQPAALVATGPAADREEN